MFTEKQKNKLIEIWVTSEKGKKYQENKKKRKEIEHIDGRSDKWVVLDSFQRRLKKELDTATKKALTDKQKKYLKEEEKDKKKKDKERISEEFKKSKIDQKYKNIAEMFTDKQKEKLIEIWVTSEKGRVFREVIKKKKKIRDRYGKIDKYKELKYTGWDLQKKLDEETKEILTDDQKQRLEEIRREYNQKKKKKGRKK